MARRKPKQPAPIPEDADGGAATGDIEMRSQQAFLGRSAQLAVMAEFLYRRINVAIPEVDVGEDIFVVKGADDRVTRVQVKAAKAQEQKDSYAVRFNVPLAQLSLARDTPPLVYVFPIRYRNRWSDFIVIRRSALFALHNEGAGARFADTKGRVQVQFRIVIRATTAWCGPEAAANLQPYRDAWEPWPPPQPPHVTEAGTPSAP